jgi:hypothetical protein
MDCKIDGEMPPLLGVYYDKNAILSPHQFDELHIYLKVNTILVYNVEF